MCGGCRPAICEIIAAEATLAPPASFVQIEGLVGAG
jgi:hypothetical protein